MRVMVVPISGEAHGRIALWAACPLDRQGMPALTGR
jgi:hypothetical protein